MEYNKSEISLPCLTKLYDGNVEQSIDADFTLPDYYPEVTKILKSVTDVTILTAQCNESGISIGGQIVITLMYAGGDGHPNSFTHIVPFTKSVAVSNVADGTAVVEPRINYANTKAVGPRKVEIHGSMALKITVDCIEQHRLLTSAVAEGLYVKSRPVTYSCPMPTISKSAFVEDDIQIPQSKPSVGKILRQNATAEITECKYVSGKLVAKGDLTVVMLYCPQDDGEPILLEEKRGFSQVFDIEHSGEGLGFDSVAQVDTLELHPKTSLDGEVKTIAFEARVSINIFPYCTVTNDIITDAFSGRFSADIVKKELCIENISDYIHENFVCSKALDFSGGMLSSILDMWCNSSVDFVSNDGLEIAIKGNIIINLLGTDSDNEPIYFERPVEFEYKYATELSTQNIRCRPRVKVVAINYSLDANGTVSVSVELCVKATVFTVTPLCAISDIKFDENTLISKDNDSAVILYFPENETVWEIAEKYKTSPEKICEINGVSGQDEKCNSIMLIPNI